MLNIFNIKNGHTLQRLPIFSHLKLKLYKLKNCLLILFLLITNFAKAQKIDSIYVNLYTDSLKKGTYNYINVDGLMSNGRYLPLDSTHLIFTSNVGKFFGNTLLIDKNETAEKVIVKTQLRKDTKIYKEFEIFIKKKPNDENLKTVEELFNGMQPPKPKRKKG